MSYEILRELWLASPKFTRDKTLRVTGKQDCIHFNPITQNNQTTRVKDFEQGRDDLASDGYSNSFITSASTA